VSTLGSLARLHSTAERPWKGTADFAWLQAEARTLPAASGKPEVVERAVRELAVRAFLEGHPEEAGKLLDAGHPTGKERSVDDRAASAALLRDLKATVLGKGKVQTWPVSKVLADKGGHDPHTPRGPPAGVSCLLPEGDARSWRPPVVEPASADLPPLPAAITPVIEAQRVKVEGLVKQERKTNETHKAHTIRQARVHVPPPRSTGSGSGGGGVSSDDDDLTELEKALGRPVTAEEKALLKKLRPGKRTR
jgi:hypothetical protein